MSTGHDVRFLRHRPVLAMAAPSHRVGRGNFKLKNKMNYNAYSKIKYNQAIRDVLIKLCKSSSFFVRKYGNWGWYRLEGAHP